MIELVRPQNRIRVQLNIDLLDEYAFHVSSQLVRLATLYSLDNSSEAAK